MMLAHRAVRTLMNEAAQYQHLDPDRLSFTHSLRVIRRKLAAIGFSAAILSRDLERESSIRSHKAGEIANLLQDALKRTRDLARGLSPVDRDEGGLESALNELASSTSRLSGISCSFICVGQVEIRDNARAVHLFRIAQEALNNAIKHGHPKVVVVALEASNGALSLRVSDDGVGFDPAGSERKGMGLNIMRYRARMLAGTLEIQSNSPVGTMVTCTIARPPAPARGSN